MLLSLGDWAMIARRMLKSLLVAFENVLGINFLVSLFSRANTDRHRLDLSQ
jgi:hypothetical protein